MTQSETAKTKKPSSAPDKARESQPRGRPGNGASRSGESNGSPSRRPSRESAEGSRPGGAKPRRRPSVEGERPRRSSSEDAPRLVKKKKRPVSGDGNGAALSSASRAATSAEVSASPGAPPKRRRKKKRRPAPARRPTALSWLWSRAGLLFQSFRLMVVLVGLGLALVAAAGLGFFKNPRTPSNSSPTYEGAVAYSSRFEDEKGQYEPPMEALIILPGAEMEENDVNPAENHIRQRIIYSVARPPHFVAEEIVGLWQTSSMVVERGKSDGKGGFSLSARSPQRGDKAIIASVKPVEGNPGRSRVSATILRQPTDVEETWFKYPDDLPEGPAGSKLDVKSGAMGPSKLGRVYSWTMPIDVNEARDYFRLAMLRKGWVVQPLSMAQEGSPAASANGRQTATYSYLCSKGADSYTMSVSILGGSGSGRSAVVFIAF